MYSVCHILKCYLLQCALPARGGLCPGNFKDCNNWPIAEFFRLVFSAICGIFGIDQRVLVSANQQIPRGTDCVVRPIVCLTSARLSIFGFQIETSSVWGVQHQVYATLNSDGPENDGLDSGTLSALVHPTEAAYLLPLLVQLHSRAVGLSR